MSRHHHRFERDYRGPWERRDIRPTGLHNGGANHSCASAVVNGNNRPGLLPLPVIPSLLPTPVTVAVTTSSGDIAVKRGITAAGSVASASAKVRTPSKQRGGHVTPCDICGKRFTTSLFFCGYLIHKDFPIEHQRPLSPAVLQLSSFPFYKDFWSVHLPGMAVLMVQLSGLIHSVSLSVSLCCLLPPSPLTAALCSTVHSCQNHFLSISIFSLCQMAEVHLLCLLTKFLLSWWKRPLALVSLVATLGTNDILLFNTPILVLAVGIICKVDLSI